MYLLRRAALRAVTQQSTRHITTIRSTPFIATRPATLKPVTLRSFHQTRLWLAQEHDRTALEEEGVSPAAAETVGETVPPESGEESMAAADLAEDAADEAEAAEMAAQQTDDVEVQEGAEYVANDAAQRAQAAAAAAATASAAPSREFPPRNYGSAASYGSDSGFLPGPPVPVRILYVGNLFFEVTAQALEAEFSRFGTVMNSRIVSDSRGLSKGFGYIEFEDQNSADRALQELDQKILQGRRMSVQYHKPKERRPGGRAPGGEFGARPVNPPSKTLFIGNMSYQMSDRDLNDLFREVRDVLDVRVAIDRRSGQPRGFAHADFVDVASAEKAKESLEQKVVYGRQLRVDFSAGSSKSRMEGGD